MTPAGPTAETVVGVVRREVARLGLDGVVLASPPGPASDLLAAWMAPTLPLHLPDAGAVADVAGALAAAGAPGGAVEALAWRSVADARAAAEGLLPVATLDKTRLLLDPAPLPARVLPLGDLWASALAEWTGAWDLPPVLAHAGPDEVARVEAALRAYLAEGVAPERAFQGLRGLAPFIRRALDASEGRRRGLLVPKLERWTVGADLAR